MQTGEDLARHYASGDLFIFPSITETFGNVVTEAMASGLVTLAYDYAAPGRYIQHATNGFIAELNNSRSYLNQLDQALDTAQNWPAISVRHEKPPKPSAKHIISAFAEELTRPIRGISTP